MDFGEYYSNELLYPIPSLNTNCHIRHMVSCAEIKIKKIENLLSHKQRC